MRSLLILLLMLVPAHAAAGGDAETEILAVMKAAEDGWNTGDLEAYMVGYWRSEELRFASGGTVARGWETTLERYVKGYPDQATMGTLAFSDMDVTLLSDDAAYVFGRWRLDRAEDAPEGLFTLIFRKTGAGWRIVHDHTSSAD